MTSLRGAREHDPRVHLVSPDESERGALGAAFDATEDPRLVRVQELAGLHVRGPTVPSVRHAVERDDGELVRRRESVEMRGDGGEVARALGERGRRRFLPAFFVVVEEVGDRVDDEQLERRTRTRFGVEDRGGEHVGEDVEERGDRPRRARLDVVERAGRSCELRVRA